MSNRSLAINDNSRELDLADASVRAMRLPTFARLPGTPGRVAAHCFLMGLSLAEFAALSIVAEHTDEYECVDAQLQQSLRSGFIELPGGEELPLDRMEPSESGDVLSRLIHLGVIHVGVPALDSQSDDIVNIWNQSHVTFTDTSVSFTASGVNMWQQIESQVLQKPIVVHKMHNSVSLVISNRPIVFGAECIVSQLNHASECVTCPLLESSEPLSCKAGVILRWRGSWWRHPQLGYALMCAHDDWAIKAHVDDINK